MGGCNSAWRCCSAAAKDEAEEEEEEGEEEKPVVVCLLCFRLPTLLRSLLLFAFCFIYYCRCCFGRFAAAADVAASAAAASLFLRRI